MVSAILRWNGYLRNCITCIVKSGFCVQSVLCTGKSLFLLANRLRELKIFVDKSTNEINTLNKSIIDNEEKLKNCEDKINSFNKEKDELFSLKQNVDSSLLNLDVHTLQSRKDKIKEEGNSINIQITNVDNEIKSIGEIDYSDEEYRKLIEQREELVNTIATIKADIQILKNQTDALTKAEFCPTCGQKLANVDNSTKIEENNKSKQSLITKGVNEDKKLTQVTITKITTVMIPKIFFLIFIASNKHIIHK